MNKKFIYAVSVLIFLFFGQNSYSQTATIDLQIFEPLPQVDLGSILVQNNLNGAPKVFYVQISPPGIQVFVRGAILWNRNDGGGFKTLFTFETDKFLSRSFYSDELGTSGLRIVTSDAVSSLTDDLISRGMPTGSFRFSLSLFNAGGSQLSQTSKDVTFSNPSQTLTIITPASNSTQSVGSIIARWSQINGASKYRIKLNIRRDPLQSLEDAMESGTPLINNKEVSGSVTNADLRSLLEREWLPGQELVLQIAAVVSGVGGGSDLKSEIVNFQISQGSGTPVDNAKNALITFLTQLQNEQATQFIPEINNASMNDIKFYNNEGSEISFAQFQSIVNSILSSIVKITLTNQ